MTVRILTVSAAAAALLAPCSPAQARTSGAPGWAPTRERAWTARVVTVTDARARPGAGKVRLRLRAQAPWTGGPVGLLVLNARRDPAGELWLKVRLPARPNDAAGWVDADHVRTSSTHWRVVVRTGRRTVSVYRRGRLARRFGAVVGKPSTPTPRGLFAVAERARQPEPGAFLGPWALHLTAHSDVLDNFGGGPGRVAVHGRAGASLLDPLGSAVSHGCVRVDNGAVSWMAARLRPGTPVRVTR